MKDYVWQGLAVMSSIKAKILQKEGVVIFFSLR
jgi:hypothetical protein